MFFITRKLKKIKQKLRNKSAIKRMVEKCSEYMVSGWWHVECQYGKYVLKKGIFPEKRSIKNIFRSLFFGIYWINNCNPKAQCGKALASPFDNYKLFDEVNGKVYTMYSAPYWNKIESFCEGMQPYFQTEILSVDNKNRVLVERYIKDTQEVDTQKCFHFICEEYKNYLKHIEIGEKTITAAYVRDVLDSAELPKDVKGYLDHIEKHIADYDVQYPVILCHNDVQTTNILTSDNESFILIDCELCGENVCFFDFMSLIFTSAVFMNDLSLYHAYMRGSFDEQLKELYSICGIQYDVCDREQHLFSFLLFRIYMIYVNNPYRLREYPERVWAFFRQNGLL